VGLHSLDNWLLLLVFSIQLETYGLSCAVIEHVRKRMTVVKGFKCGWYSICLDINMGCAPFRKDLTPGPRAKRELGPS